MSSSAMLPFWTSLAALLLLAVVAAGSLGRTSVSDVPATLAEYQRVLATEMAQNVRRGLNEGVADLEHAASNIDAGDMPDSVISDMRDVHDRYEEADLVGDDGRSEAGIAPITRDGDEPAIEMHAPLASGASLVARYDPTFLRFALASAEPSVTYLIDEDGRILSASTGYLPYADLPSTALRDAARKALDGSTGASSPDRGTEGSVVAWAPVSGEGPGGQLGLAVVSTRSLGSFSLPATDVRREGLVVAVLVAVLTVAVFSWVWLVVLMPLRRLRDETDRVVRGDFSTPVAIIRYDEIGLVSRALDRLRVLLIGARVPTAAHQAVAVGRTASRTRSVLVALAVLLGLALFVVLLSLITTIGADAEQDQIGSASDAPEETTSTSLVVAVPLIAPLSCEARPGVVVYRAEVTLDPPIGGRVDAVVAVVEGTAERGRATATAVVPRGAEGTLAAEVVVDGAAAGSCEVRSVTFSPENDGA